MGGNRYWSDGINISSKSIHGGWQTEIQIILEISSLWGAKYTVHGRDGFWIQSQEAHFMRVSFRHYSDPTSAIGRRNWALTMKETKISFHIFIFIVPFTFHIIPCSCPESWQLQQKRHPRQRKRASWAPFPSIVLPPSWTNTPSSAGSCWWWLVVSKPVVPSQLRWSPVCGRFLRF